MNKLRRLAKLRQYKGGNVGEYLQGEHRQNLIAIEEALRINDTQEASQPTANVNDVLWYWTQKTTFANVRTAVATDQPLDFTDINSISVLKFGEIGPGEFRPGFTGKLLIETRFFALFGTVNRAMSINLSSSDPAFFYGLNFVTDGSGAIRSNRRGNVILDVNPGTVIYFKYSSDIATSSLSGGCLSLKLTRIE